VKNSFTSGKEIKKLLFRKETFLENGFDVWSYLLWRTVSFLVKRPILQESNFCSSGKRLFWILLIINFDVWRCFLLTRDGYGQ